jgi:hypothetical protein
MTQLRPPPVPRAPIAAPPVGQTMSQDSKDKIAEMAIGLLEEQVQARIVHYKAELETNPELDAITASVVAQLKQMQESMAPSAPKPNERGDIAAQQERTLKTLLARLFPAGPPTLIVEKRIKTALRNLARLFFQSELHERTRGGETGVAKVIQHGEQAMFYLLGRYHHRMHNELQNFEFASEEVRERSFELLQKLTKDMQDAFLARRSTELKRIVGAFNAVLVDFVSRQLPAAIAELSHEVIAQSGSADGRAYGYKIVQTAFPRFRSAFERRLMVRLVSFVEDELVRRLADTSQNTREETIAFITNPEIFSMICGELSAGAYEYLCNEGFLDLPPEWHTTS